MCACVYVCMYVLSHLKVIGTLMMLSGDLEFKRNHVDGEGALYLLLFGQMQLSQSTSIKFEENNGR